MHIALLTWQVSCVVWCWDLEKVCRFNGFQFVFNVFFILLNLVHKGLKLGNGLVSTLNEFWYTFRQVEQETTLAWQVQIL